MSIRNDAFFYFKPSAYKQGKIYTQIPISGQADLDVERETYKNRLAKGQVLQNMDQSVPTLSYIKKERNLYGKPQSCPVLNIEEQKFNYQYNSHDQNTGTYSYSGTNVDFNAKRFIDGSKIATFVENLNSSSHVRSDFEFLSEQFSTSFTYSGYVKNHKTSKFFYVNITTQSEDADFLLNIDSCNVESVKHSSGIKASARIYTIDEEKTQDVKQDGVTPNPWMRFECTIEFPNNQYSFNPIPVRILMKPKFDNLNQLEDLTPGATCFYNGFQWENDLFASSLIRSNNSAGFRGQDNIYKEFSGVELRPQTTIFADFKPSRLIDNKQGSYFSIANSNGQERFDIWVSWKYRVYFRNIRNGNQYYSIYGDFDPDQRLRCVFTMESGRCVLYMNGRKIYEKNSCEIPLGTRHVSFQNHTLTNRETIFKGDVHEFFALPYVVTENQAINLTQYNP